VCSSIHFCVYTKYYTQTRNNIQELPATVSMCPDIRIPESKCVKFRRIASARDATNTKGAYTDRTHKADFLVILANTNWTKLLLVVGQVVSFQTV
jgi:hypothetical protein